MLIVDPKKWSAMTFTWASPLYQLNKDPSKALLASTRSRIVIMRDGRYEPLHHHAARHAFFNIGQAQLVKMAGQLKIEVPTGSGLFEVCWALIGSLLVDVGDDQLLKIMEHRVVDREVSRCE